MRTATGDIPLGPTFLAAGGLDHGYAITIHQAQGLTTDTALLLGGDHLYREAGYVALSRGRTHNAVYLADQPDNLTHCAELPHAPPREGADSRDPHAALTRALHTGRAQTMASGMLTAPGRRPRTRHTPKVAAAAKPHPWSSAGVPSLQLSSLRPKPSPAAKARSHHRGLARQWTFVARREHRGESEGGQTNRARPRVPQRRGHLSYLGRTSPCVTQW